MEKGSSDESFCQLCESNGVTPDAHALINCYYTGYEIKFSGYWDESGNFWATELNGVPLKELVKL